MVIELKKYADQFELYRNCRYLDKLFDELAKGRKMEKILQSRKEIKTGTNNGFK